MSSSFPRHTGHICKAQKPREASGHRSGQSRITEHHHHWRMFCRTVWSWIVLSPSCSRWHHEIRLWKRSPAEGQSSQFQGGSKADIRGSAVLMLNWGLCPQHREAPSLSFLSFIFLFLSHQFLPFVFTLTLPLCLSLLKEKFIVSGLTAQS